MAVVAIDALDLADSILDAYNERKKVERFPVFSPVEFYWLKEISKAVRLRKGMQC